MTIVRISYIVLALGLLALSSAVDAAELRGRLVGLSGATVNVKCDKGGGGSASIAANGNYVVRGLPGGDVCSFSVRKDNASSAAIKFSTSRSLTLYSGSLSAYGNTILVTRK